jgi:hypothetical protein
LQFRHQRSELTGDLNAVTWRTYVANDQLNASGASKTEGNFCTHGLEKRISPAFKGYLEHFEYVWVVFQQQNRFHIYPIAEDLSKNLTTLR